MNFSLSSAEDEIVNTMKPKIGLVGLGRLGSYYVSLLSGLARVLDLVAVADPIPDRARALAGEYQIPKSYPDSLALMDDPEIDAVLIVTPTSTHRELIEAAASRNLAVFCEKPLALTLTDALAARQAVERSGIFFHMGFMRRFDPAYRRVKAEIDSGRIGSPVFFRSTSRDAFPPPLEFVDPAKSGGLIIDMGIHDIDLARWYVGRIDSLTAVGSALAYPEMKSLGEVDNAIVTLVFEKGPLGVLDMSRTAVYGYDVWTEIVGTEGTLQIGRQTENSILTLRKGVVCADTFPSFKERFHEAFRSQLEDFARNLSTGTPPSVSIEDGIHALRVALAATQALHSGAKVVVPDLSAPNARHRRQQSGRG